MKIVVLGAGRVGGTLVEELSKEDHDITLVDKDIVLLRKIQEKHDIRTVHGFASHPDVLAKAKLDDADLLIAVTASDETNMIACQIAYSVFETPKKIARVRSKSYLDCKSIFENNSLPVDVCISPEQLVTKHIERLIRYPGAFQVLEFSVGKLLLIGIRVEKGGPLTGRLIDNIYLALKDIRFKILAIYRDKRSIPVRGQTTVEDGDEIFFITVPNHVREIVNSFGRLQLPNKRIMIAGGGNIGAGLARRIEKDYQVKLIEKNIPIASNLSIELNQTLVLLGEVQDGDLLEAENIENMDVFCAVTNDDEANIISSIQAKKLGARLTMTLINRKSYVNLLDKNIDILIAPSEITIGSILSHIRHVDVDKVYSLRRGNAEAIEVIAHGDKETSDVIGKSIAELSLPDGVIIGAIARDDTSIIAEPDFIIQADDHLIIFVMDKNCISQIEKIFQVKINYIGS
ncbi:MAG: Trk system potassium transporter TrkA [Legionellales bacterium]|nr:Trk system potassium transporter TrkA [Legionellales bacterium]